MTRKRKRAARKVRKSWAEYVFSPSYVVLRMSRETKSRWDCLIGILGALTIRTRQNIYKRAEFSFGPSLRWNGLVWSV